MRHVAEMAAGRRRACGLVCCLGIVAAAGCGGNKYKIEIDTHFSYNVVCVPSWFPAPKMQLGPAQAEVLARHGKPDFFRIWWRDDGSLVTSSDLSGKHEKMSEIMQATKQTWIYLTENKEIHFTADGGGYRERDLDSVIRLVCQYGDPSDRSRPIEKKGHVHESWRWIEYGLQIDLVDGKEVKRSYFDRGTGSGTWGSR